MNVVVIVVIAVVALAVLGLLLAIRIVQQYEMGVHFRLGKVIGVRMPGRSLARRSRTIRIEPSP